MKINTSVTALFTLFVATASQAALVSFQDGTFTNTVSTRVTGPGSQSAARMTSNGNPGDYLQVVTGNDLSVQTTHINPLHIYTPSAGAITGLTYGIEFDISFAYGQGMGYGIVATQDGASFRSHAGITGSVDAGWKPYQSATLVEADFSPFAGGSLDFSSSGSPITFGFYTANSGGSSITIGYDNFDVALQTIPEPSTLALWAIPSLGLLFFRRLYR